MKKLEGRCEDVRTVSKATEWIRRRMEWSNNKEEEEEG